MDRKTLDWIKKKIKDKERASIYSSSRMKAYTVLKNRHKEEYKTILTKLLKKKFNSIK